MKERTKRILKITAASIIKNDAAIEGAKTAPWWIAVVMFIIGNFLPIIPIMVNASKTYGAQFISGNVYGYDQALASVSSELGKEDSPYKLEVKDHKLLAYKDGNALVDTWNEDADLTPIATYDAVTEDATTRYLSVYYTDRPFGKGVYSVKQMIKSIEARKLKLGTIEEYDASSEDLSYTPSYLILYKDGVYSKIYKASTEKKQNVAASATYTGMNWKNNEDMDLIQNVLDVEGIEANLADLNYVKAVMNNWKVVFNNGYKDQKVMTFWATSGIYYGIYLGLGIFMGLMMFLLTRGKNNPNRNLNMWITCKIAAWITFSPAVLAMAVAFFWSAAAGIGFIVLMGLRTMWLAMRQLNPIQQQQ